MLKKKNNYSITSYNSLSDSSYIKEPSYSQILKPLSTLILGDNIADIKKRELGDHSIYDAQLA